MAQATVFLCQTVYFRAFVTPLHHQRVLHQYYLDLKMTTNSTFVSPFLGAGGVKKQL